MVIWYRYVSLPDGILLHYIAFMLVVGCLSSAHQGMSDTLASKGLFLSPAAMALYQL